jgi:transcriptional regulator with XRE-family HTH domain
MTPSGIDPRHDRLRDILVTVRKRKKLTQIELGAKLGKTQIWVSRYESGPRQLDVIEFLDITGAIGVDPCSILKRLRG